VLGDRQADFRRENWRRSVLIALGILGGLLLIFHRPFLLGIGHKVALRRHWDRSGRRGGFRMMRLVKRLPRAGIRLSGSPSLRNGCDWFEGGRSAARMASRPYH